MAIVTRTFVEKSNTIIEGSCGNMGANPILELNKCNLLSRGMIYFDHNKVKKLVDDKTYPDISKLRHVLKMTNTCSLRQFEKYKPCFSYVSDELKKRATSFDLIFFLINKEWDEGKGYDYIVDMHKGSHSIYSEDGSNWLKCKNHFRWDEDGIYSVGTLSFEMNKFLDKRGNQSKIIIGTQHFDIGNEDINFDLTDIFNKFISGELTNYGIGIAFEPSFETEIKEKTEYVGFFTQHTHSFFEPYVETTYDDTIEDDRTNFYLDKDNKLYFYASVGGNYVNLDEMPTCTINGVEYAVKQQTKGIYYIEVNLSSDEYEYDTMLYDVWSNLKYKNKSLKDVELQFVTKASDDYFSFGLPSQKEEVEIVPSVYGINANERIKRGDIRKVNIDCRIPYTTNQMKCVDGLEYRVYVDEGLKQYDIVSWTKCERGYNENYFLVNTLDLIPYRYYIDIRIKQGLELINHPKILQFDIINEVN